MNTTFKKRDIFVAVAIALLGMALYVVAMPNPIKTASAAGGDNPTSTTQCVAPAVTSAVDSVKEATTATETSDQSTTKTVEKTTTSHDNHDVVTVHDVTVGDILSDNEVTVGDINVLNDLVDVTNNTVKVDDVLNPVTSLLSHVSL